MLKRYGVLTAMPNAYPGFGNCYKLKVRTILSKLFMCSEARDSLALQSHPNHTSFVAGLSWSHFHLISLDHTSGRNL